MTIAFDAITSFGATFTDPLGGKTVSHAGGTPKAVVVLIAQYNNGTDDTVTGVTYGGVSMTEITGSPFFKATGELCGIYAYFLGASVPSGTQDAVISTASGNSVVKHAYVITFSAAADVEIQAVDNDISSDSVADPSGSIALGGATCYVLQMGISGQASVGSVAPPAGWGTDFTPEFDFGAEVYGIYSYDTVGSSDVTYGWTQTAEDAFGIAIAIKEVATGATVSCTAGAVTVTGQSATVYQKTSVAATAATVVATGQTASIAQRTTVAATAGVVVASGQTATISETFIGAVEATPGVVTVAGQSATVYQKTSVAATAADVVVVGQGATVVQRAAVAATAAAVTVAGQPATIDETVPTMVAATAAAVTVAGQPATIDETTLVPTSIEATAGIIGVVGGDGSVTAVGGLKSRRRRAKYTTYTEPTALMPDQPPHAPVHVVGRLADVLRFEPSPAKPEPPPAKPKPVRVRGKVAVAVKPKPQPRDETESIAALLETLAAAVRKDPAVAREVIEALMPVILPRIEPEEDEEELILLLLSKFAA